MRNVRILIDNSGSVSILDPGPDALGLLQSIDPDFRICQSALPGFTSPGFLLTRSMGCGVSGDLSELSEDILWDIHEIAMADPPTGILSVDSASLLDLKIELSRRALTHCHFCAHRCGIDRTQGEKGICGLGIDATVADAFVHIAEEPPINPSLFVSIAGCGLHCQFCQQWELLDEEYPGERLDADLWKKLPVEGARSLSFIGGNPDESLYAILRFLATAPSGWSLPIVWNSHGYGTPETARLLEGLVDAHIPDFKYGNDECGRELSNAPRYPEAAREAIRAMLTQGVPVIVRILVLPGHYHCCHIPALETLAGMSRENLYVSIRDQYWPDYRISSPDGRMAAPTPPDEVEKVYEAAHDLGLRLIE